MTSSTLKSSRFSITVATGKRVSRNTQAPLTLPGTLSTAGHCDQSRTAITLSLLQIKRVHKKLIRPLRLPPPLRPEPQQHYVPLPVIDVQRRRLPLDLRRSDQVPALQRTPILRI